LLITLETVFIDTFASFDTSFIVTDIRFDIVALYYYFNDNLCSLTTISASAEE
jgi:hypothetical protein